jgi:predicted CopG family antitoxin
VRIRVSKKIYDGLKKFTNEKTSLSEVIRRVILPERGEIK